MEEETEETPEILEGTDEPVEERTIPLEIMPYQKAHFDKIVQILNNEIGYLDVSAFGTGKTILALAVAVAFGMGVLVFGPKTVLEAWKKYCKKYGVHLYTAMTYNSLRGTRKTGVKHDLLIRNGDDFVATGVLEACSRHGILIVYDECHYLKNENSQLKAAHALSKEAVRLARAGANIRIAALSATPADKKENITSLFKFLGIILSDKLYTYNKSNRTYILEGLQEAINKCNKHDQDLTYYVTCKPINQSTAKTVCHDLYNMVLKNHITSSMPQPPATHKKVMKNLFAIFPPEDLQRMKNGASLFASATSYREDTKQVDYSKMNWGAITVSRREIDSSKVNTIVRLAEAELKSNPNLKVVIFYTFKRDMYDTAKLLAKYNPLILNGDVTDVNKRIEIMDKFQAPNTNHRVCISNPRVGGVGVELDDKHGAFPRVGFIAPNFNFIDQFQCTGRLSRQGTKSDVRIYFVYSREFQYEENILNSMAVKSKVARDMSQSNQMNILYPGELDELVEKTEAEILEEKMELESLERDE